MIEKLTIQLKMSSGGINYKRFDKETLKDIYHVARDIEIKGDN